MLTDCPHCHARVTLNQDGTCPHCGRVVARFDPQERIGAVGAEEAQSGPFEVKAHSDHAAREALAHASFYVQLYKLTPRVYMTHLLVAANVAVFVIMAITGVNVLRPNTLDLIRWGANFGPDTLNGQWWRLLTSVFLHIGVLHLGFNMWVLWSFGKLVERLVGNVGFLLLYLLSGIGGSLASVWWNPDVLSAGASGAIFGLFGVLLGFIVLRRDTIPLEVLRSLRKSGLAFIGYNVLFGLLYPGIDNAAHLGGLATGFLGGLVVSQPLVDDIWFGRVVRNALVVVLGSGAVACAIVAAPPSTQPLVDEVESYEKGALETYREAVQRHERGELSDEALAEIVENEVLPPWRKLQANLEALKQHRRNLNENFDDYCRSAELREQGWTRLVEALRETDPAKRQRLMKEHGDAMAAADALIEKVNKEQ